MATGELNTQDALEPLFDVIGRVSGELRDVATLIEQLEPMLSDGQSEEYLESPEHMRLLQGVDLAVQKAKGLASFLDCLGDELDVGHLVDITHVPGLAGVGPKTAAKWLQAHGSLEALLESADAIKGKAGQTLRDNLEQVRLARELTGLDAAVSLPKSWSELDRDPADDALHSELLNDPTESLSAAMSAPLPLPPASPPFGNELLLAGAPRWSVKEGRLGRLMAAPNAPPPPPAFELPDDAELEVFDFSGEILLIRQNTLFADGRRFLITHQTVIDGEPVADALFDGEVARAKNGDLILLTLKVQDKVQDR